MQVRAELAGNLWKILVRPGQQIAADDTIMILESMKMEIPVAAPVSGTVTRIAVIEGQPVQEGDLLADID
ncbi:MAG TPA: biotin/lipoyl-binding carrier protein [Candidatus Limnocylindrales bacterium]|nr:biotin/lipoyl-binding carrier protein [Candidatus Limnocylindrales bacterium]